MGGTMTPRWKRSRDDGFAETHDGVWQILPRYWGHVRPVEYTLKRGTERIGTFDTQRAAKKRAAELQQNI